MSRRGKSEFWLDQVTGSQNWYINWYDAGSRRTRRKSTETADYALAQVRLAEHILGNAKLVKAPRHEVQIAVLLHQWLTEHGSKQARAKSNARAVDVLLEEFGTETLAELNAERRDRLIASLRAREWVDSYINTIIAVLRAAIRRAWRLDRIESIPFVQGVKDNEPKPKHIFTPDQFAEFLERSYRIEYLFRFVMLQANTMARPGAIYDLTPFQVFDQHGYIDLNPAGRAQNNKFRPKVPITETLRSWLPLWPCNGRYVECGKTLKGITKVFDRVGSDMGLTVTPYSVRHTMATIVAKAGVPREQRDRHMGHKNIDGSKMGERYVHFEPTWLEDSKNAIDAFLGSLPVHFNMRPSPRRLTLVAQETRKSQSTN